MIYKHILSAVLATASLFLLISCGGEVAETAQTPVTSVGGITVHLPETKVMYTDNFTVTDKMAQFQFNSIYKRFKDALYTEGTDPSDVGILTGLSLKEQVCTVDSSYATWYDYFIDQTEYSLMEQLVLCEAARAAGISLDEVDLASVQSAASEIKKSAELLGVSEADYIKTVYGDGVTYSDITDSLELMYLAEKYLNICIDSADTSDSSLEQQAYEDAVKSAAESYPVTIDREALYSIDG